MKNSKKEKYKRVLHPLARDQSRVRSLKMFDDWYILLRMVKSSRSLSHVKISTNSSFCRLKP